MEAANQARVDVAEAKMKGEIGSKLLEGKMLQNAAKIDAETKIIATQREGQGKKEEIKVKTEVKVFENEREAEVAEANAELATKKAKWAKDSKVAEVEASKAVALREAELQKEVEIMNALTQTEKFKAEFLSKASVKYETKVQEANWELYKEQKAVYRRRQRKSISGLFRMKTISGLFRNLSFYFFSSSKFLIFCCLISFWIFLTDVSLVVVDVRGGLPEKTKEVEWREEIIRWGREGRVCYHHHHNHHRCRPTNSSHHFRRRPPPQSLQSSPPPPPPPSSTCTSGVADHLRFSPWQFLSSSLLEMCPLS